MIKGVALLCRRVRYYTLFGKDIQHDFSQRNCRTMSSIIIKLELRVAYCINQIIFNLHENFAYRDNLNI